MNEQLYKNKEWLKKQLTTKTPSQIIKEFNLPQTCVYRWIKKYDLKTINVEPLFHDEKWLREQLQTKTPNKLAKENGVDPRSIRKWAKKYNINLVSAKKHITKEWIQEKLIECNNSLREIASKYNINRKELNKECKNYNINRNEIESLCVHTRSSRYYKSSLNEDYFKTIDTEEKAYFLGFLMADGHMHKSLNNFSLNLQKKDVYIIEKLKNLLNSHHKISIIKETEKRQAIASFSVSNSKICKDLIFHGIVPKKTGKECLPDTIPIDLIKHFIRGFFDGDGCISNTGTFSLCSVSLNILNSINKYVSQFLNIDKKLRSQTFKTKEVFYYELCGSNANLLLSHLYDNATIYLTRKYERYKKFYVPSNSDI